ncbi:MAG: type II toxin-antitoxin system Phd/YefM family antitoxin [Methylobacter sp.]|nr:type II toxin-antitoxin system Phd/YefM family antitoxin [Methylobacter sp.]MDP2100772.1 type II toxin-antitoxin system Phd/YefM family antitoxin [Methylobacter sp.]MDP2427043.1 type II toxin-antitoxin system Phd/YefM family antitoxin [Methylobacter sp.]MDP3053021.1 type II toxin-antitoxin system Phd/YefM family antitoxin [Methylobacter sp.]MDP3362904.1 type II toxin-antitoxin system Phd/YefM family antitoxin [Methylobacter sp.]
MKQATFTEVRNHAKQYFDIVESGESVRVLRNGKAIADIVPIAPDLPSWKRRTAQPLVLDGVALSRLILEERDAGFFLIHRPLPSVMSMSVALTKCWYGVIRQQKLV